MKVRSANFQFLHEHDQLLVRFGAQAERYFADDPNTALIKLRQFAEVLAKNAAALSGVYTQPGAPFLGVLDSLWDRGMLTPQVSQLFHGLRKAGNAAVHEHDGTRRAALHQLKMARLLGVWFHRAFADPDYRPGPFVPPPNPETQEAGLQGALEAARTQLVQLQAQADKAKLTAAEEAKRRAEAEARAADLYGDLEAALELAEESEARAMQERAELEARLAELQASSSRAPLEATETAIRRAQIFGADLDLDEADTRKLIDQQLREAGWEADSELLRHGKGVRPTKGRNLAIAEWPTDNGPADYALFVGLKPVAIVEAKRKSTHIPSRIEQSKRYSRGFRVLPEMVDPGAPWGELHVPFLFATNGRPFLRQLLDASGVWFLDGRSPTNHPRALEGWYTPEGLQKLLDQDIGSANERLASASSDYLPLRDYQRAAIAAVERAIADEQRALLLAMATGTGKTRTAICLIYRLLKAGRFRRVLFVVDRTSLGEQAGDSFSSLKLEQLQSFTDIYDVKQLGDVTPESDTRLHIATIQGMVQRVLLSDDAGPPVDSYDLILVDECHRGYNLDRELSDAELTFRSEDDYISKYRRVLDHFDAVKIGLTATPAQHTVSIFGEPVYNYSYRQAVVDGFLVDHEPPIRIVTELAESGITWMAGEELEVYRPRTQQLELMHTPDEVTVEIDQFNKLVATESFNRVVCDELANQIDPSLPGKTLVFCATDAHADTVVRLLKQAFEKVCGPIEDDAVQKITGQADRPSQRIRYFKNERNPRVAVTVDLLTTGIDVPEIVNLVFLRRVRSRILYDQMLGRATRLCPDLGKSCFRIYDAVDLYAALLPFTAMRAVVTNPKIPFAQLVDELVSLEDATALTEVLDQLSAKLQRKKRAIAGADQATFELLAGMTPAALLDAMKTWSTPETKTWWLEHLELASWLDKAKLGDGPVLLVSNHPDALREVVRGYGDAERPEDYLDAFGAYIREHLNDLPALEVVTQRPRDLTRKQLKELKLALDQAGFTEMQLRVAWREATNQDIAATILGYIRQQALGSPLVPYEERVRTAMNTVLASRSWSPPQRKWLERIGKQLLVETIVDREALDRGQFAAQGGFQRLNKVFQGQLDEVLGEINTALWTQEANR